ncbi:MAG: cysteine desulfurase family protein [Myxococcota bacterium]|nr:cysteine desulfurase family protein [Myxococcota bacterium]
MRLPIYMDNHATTPVDPRVLETMMPFLREEFGNAASSSHAYGWHAKEAVNKARRQLAELAGVQPEEMIFTSGATESNNLALLGVAFDQNTTRKQIVTQATEHSAVLDTCEFLAKRGFETTILPVDQDGLVSAETLREVVSEKTALVSIMHGNNEIGAIQDITRLAQIAHEVGALFHSDVVQTFGKIPLNLGEMDVDLASLTAHKMYGPKGIGAFYMRKSHAVHLAPILHGGGQERGCRSGTLNVPGIVAFGTAAHLAQEEFASGHLDDLAALRDRLWEGMRDNIKGIHINGHPEKRVPGNLNIRIDGIDAPALMLSMHNVAVSGGSACDSHDNAPSHVLTAIGCTPEQAQSSVRFGVGRFNTEEEIDFVLAEFCREVKKQQNSLL